jgi:hypothetical protein
MSTEAGSGVVTALSQAVDELLTKIKMKYLTYIKNIPIGM